MTARNARLELVSPPMERTAASADRLNRIEAAVRDMAASCPVPGALRTLVERLGEPDAPSHSRRWDPNQDEARARKRG